MNRKFGEQWFWRVSAVGWFIFAVLICAVVYLFATGQFPGSGNNTVPANLDIALVLCGIGGVWCGIGAYLLLKLR